MVATKEGRTVPKMAQSWSAIIVGTLPRASTRST